MLPIRLVSAALLPFSALSCVPGPGLPFPASPFEHNGKAWGQFCVNKAQGHFFGIGDWGGSGTPGDAWPNPTIVKRRQLLPVDVYAQGYVAREVKRLAALVDPDFVLSAGDNFYPGGVHAYCSNMSQASRIANIDYTHQFATYHDNMYSGRGLDGKPWFSCLGNHDYGGIWYSLGWDVEIYRTWSPPSAGTQWRMPAIFWSQRVVYTDFTIDLFFIETNFFDAAARGVNPNHNMCQNGDGCYGITPELCPKWFRSNFDNSVTFLKNGLATSDATWKIVVTHYPGGTVTGLIATLAYKIDLVFTGHRHFQLFGSSNGMDWIISGGGGGVTTDGSPSTTGLDDAYGFIDLTVNPAELTMDMYSWGGPDPGRSIMRKSKTIRPKSSKTFTKDMLSGIRDQTADEAWEMWNSDTKTSSSNILQV